MRISTKTLVSLLIATVAETGQGVVRRSQAWSKKSRFERVLQRHDRKGELRAQLLGTSPETFRALQKQVSFEQVVRRHGFLNEQAFRKALLGKLRSELRARGWSTRKIDTYVLSHSGRAG
jgi:hypothetical protein